MKTTLMKGCAVCGEPRPYLLNVHHKDRDRSDGRHSSLEALCGRCHAVRHLRFDGVDWVPHSKSVTPRLIVNMFDAQTKALTLPKTRHQLAVQSLREHFLTHWCDDPQDGSSWDCRVLDVLQTLEDEDSGLARDIEDIWG